MKWNVSPHSKHAETPPSIADASQCIYDVFTPFVPLRTRYGDDRRRWGVDSVDEIASKYIKDTDAKTNMYFILDMYSNRVKIGVTKNIKQRFRMLNQAASTDLKLMGVIHDVDSGYEAYVHSLWDRFRVKNEWFEMHPELRQWIVENSVDANDRVAYIRNPRMPYSQYRIVG